MITVGIHERSGLALIGSMLQMVKKRQNHAAFAVESASERYVGGVAECHYDFVGQVAKFNWVLFAAVA